MRLSLFALASAFLAITQSLSAQTPTLKSVTPSDKAAAVAYSAVPGATSYNIYWATAPNVTPQNATGHGSNTGVAFTVPSLVDGTPYYFVVTAVTAAGESPVSNEITATPTATANHGSSGPSVAATPAQPTTNVGQASGTNVQNPTMNFAVMTPASYPILSSIAGAPTGKLSYDAAGVEKLVTDACTSAFNPTSGFSSAFDDGATYVVINVINLAGTADAQNVASNNWYLYSKHKTFASGFAGGWKVTDFDGATRLYGAKKILLLSILENDLTPASNGNPAISYTLTVTKQQATNVSDALQLLGLVFPQAKAAGTDATPASYWACGVVPVAYKTSTIKIDLAYSAGGGSPYSASQSFTNEAKEHWDFSFALPVKKASALQYSSTANTVTASQINKTDLFAVFDWYPYPVDLKNSKFTFIPGVFGGVAMNSQPLHSLLFGASVGAKLAQVYVGALLLKQQQLNGLSTGSTATTAQLSAATSYAYKPSFSIGIKISISAAAAAISGSK